ncbi:TetR/AcrR family transcriptional regulator [Smaragdicoccus niigatensis]|uniref:TetR/AcrR family transcriptional regulator n=1 Tax=Smaragdicoccus niigatensis TaxID=359359 RepID=UPI0003619661|nr:TetR/AcrR family transcriptional regulator [Smaragdicoccus niigatensis]
MTITQTSSYHHGDLRDALLARAEETLRTSGVGTLSLRQLARDVGVSHGAPSRHFRDKQALLDALAMTGFERLGAVLGATCTGSFAERLTSLARAYVQFATQNSALLELMFARKHSPTAGDELPAAAAQAFAAPLALILEGQQSGEVIAGDPETIGFTAFATLQGLATFVSSGFVPVGDVENMVADVAANIMNGLRPRS